MITWTIWIKYLFYNMYAVYFAFFSTFWLNSGFVSCNIYSFSPSINHSTKTFSYIQKSFIIIFVCCYSSLSSGMFRRWMDLCTRIYLLLFSDFCYCWFYFRAFVRILCVCCPRKIRKKYQPTMRSKASQVSIECTLICCVGSFCLKCICCCDVLLLIGSHVLFYVRQK